MDPGELASFENLVASAYSGDGDARQAAAQLEPYQKFDRWKQNLWILSNSKSEYALHFVLQNIRNIVTKNLNSFSLQERNDIRAQLKQALIQLGESFWNSRVVLPALVEGYCRIQKLCWFDSEGPSEELINDMLPFLQHSLAHSIVGLQVLRALVFEMSHQLPNLPYSRQRKTAIVFREKCLLELFKLGLQSVRRVLQSPPPSGEVEQRQTDILRKSSLELVHQVLNYDFIGTNPDGTSDEVGVIHMPISWREFFRQEKIVALLIAVYQQWPPPHSTSALSIIEQLAGVRQTLFKEPDRIPYLSTIVDGIGLLLSSNKDIDNPKHRHIFSRTLMRLKGNYQLSHLVSTPNYRAFIEKVAEFSVMVFQDGTSLSTVYYLVSFWSRMMAAHVLMSGRKSSAITDLPKATMLTEIIPKLLHTWLESLLKLAGTDVGEEMLNSEQLENLLVELPSLARCNYSSVCTMVYQALINRVNSIPPQNSNTKREEMVTLDRQLTWLVYFACSVISANRAQMAAETRLVDDMKDLPALIDSTHMMTVSQEMTDTSRQHSLYPSQNGQGNDTDEPITMGDAQLICALFELLNTHDQAIQVYGPRSESTPYLERAFLYFLKRYSQLYLAESAIACSDAIFSLLGERLDMGSATQVVERILTKVVMTMKLWNQQEEIVNATISKDGLFWALVTGYSLGNLVGKSPMAAYLLTHHNELSIGDDPIVRKHYYRTLGRLLFAGKTSVRFIEFIRPVETQIQQLQSIPQSRPVSQQEESLIIRVLTDLRGLVGSIYSKDKGFMVFFEWHYYQCNLAQFLNQLLQHAATMHLSDDCCYAVVKYICEISSNRQRRIEFPLTSGDGIRLFRSTAEIWLIYSKLIQRTMAENPDLDAIYKSVKVYLRGIHALLVGGYTNFGVFEIYNDNILTDVFTTTCALLFILQPSHLTVYPSTRIWAFRLLSTMITHHCAFFVLLPTDRWRQLMELLLFGLQAKDKTLIPQCAAALECIFGSHVSRCVTAGEGRLLPKDQKLLEPMQEHISNHRDIVTKLLVLLLDLALTFEGVYWTVSKPLLALIILSQQEFPNIQRIIISSQSRDESRRQRFESLLSDLMKGVEPNLEIRNKEKFTTNLTVFRAGVKDFLDLDAFYKAIIQFVGE